MPVLDVPVTAACSFLFVPADRPERLPKALASGADMVIADWEDAIAPAHKASARRDLAVALAALPAPERARVLVRINAAGTPWHLDDLQALRALVDQGMAGVVLAKAEQAQDLGVVGQAAGPRAALLPLIESVAGLDAVDALARAPQVRRLLWGHLDFQVDAGIDCASDVAELLPMRMALVLASRRAGLDGPVDGVTVDTRDSVRFNADAERARRMGFGGKLCIHPTQVPALHRVFDPDAAAVARATRVVQALQIAGGGVCVLDGRMVDAPVSMQAQRVLDLHARAQGRVTPTRPVASPGTQPG